MLHEYISGSLIKKLPYPGILCETCMEAGFVRSTSAVGPAASSQEGNGHGSEVLIVPQQLCPGNHNNVVHMPMAPLHFSAVSTPPLTPSVSAVISCSDREQDNQSVFKLDTKSNGSVVGPKRTSVWVENSGTIYVYFVKVALEH